MNATNATQAAAARYAPTMMRTILLMVMLTACGGGDSDSPSMGQCETAVGAYYDAGCQIRDYMGNGQKEFATETEAVAECNYAAPMAEQYCPAKFDAWTTCLESAMTCGGCDAQEQAVLFGCQ